MKEKSISKKKVFQYPYPFFLHSSKIEKKKEKERSIFRKTDAIQKKNVSIRCIRFPFECLRNIEAN